MTLFESALEDLMAFEGLYSDNPLDKGGKTKFGITTKTARAWGYKGKMSELPYEIAVEIYRTWYWNECRCEDLADYDTAIAKEVFEAGVNCGVVEAGKWLQKSINLLITSNYGIEVDGIIGRKTLRALNNRKRVLDKITLLKLLNTYQGQYYIYICTLSKGQRIFLHGWMKRVFSKED